MNEIEVKVLNIDKIAVKEKLGSAGAELIKRELQTNMMFDYPDRRFFEKGGYVRIRTVIDLLDSSPSSPATRHSSSPQSLVTFKELISKDKFKISKEIEFKADETENIHAFLEAIGLTLVRTDEKLRESYQLEDGLIEIDTWAGVPTYLEAEADTEEKVVKLLNTIDYTLEQSTSMTLSEIMKHFNLGNSDMLFSEEEKKKFM